MITPGHRRPAARGLAPVKLAARSRRRGNAVAEPALMDWLNLLVSALTLVVFVVSIRFLGRQITEQQRQIAQQQLQIEKADQQVTKEHDWNRRKAVIELSLDYSSAERIRLRKQLESVIDWYDPGQDYSTLTPGQREQLTPDLKQMLNYLEGIAVGIKHSIYDRDIAYEFFGAQMPAICRWCKPWIDDIRAHAGDPSILEAMETLSAQWDLRNRDIVRELESPAWREGKAPT
jgi:hypothetical protein